MTLIIGDIVKWWHDNLFHQIPLLMFEFYQTIQLWPISASCDVVTQVILMMTHIDWALQISPRTTWQDTQHHTHSHWAIEPFKIRMSSEDDIRGRVRSAEPEADWECSFSVSIHFSQTQEPRVAAVFLLLLTSESQWVRFKSQDTVRGVSPSSHNGDSDMYIWCVVWPVSVITRAGFLCCIVIRGQACLLAPAAGAWSTKGDQADNLITARL